MISRNGMILMAITEVTIHLEQPQMPVLILQELREVLSQVEIDGVALTPMAMVGPI